MSGSITERFMFQNHYACPECSYTWTDVWDCGVDDTCPKCGHRHVSPYQSNALIEEGASPLNQAVAALLTEHGLDALLDAVVAEADARHQATLEQEDSLGVIQMHQDRESSINRMEELFAEVKKLSPAPVVS
jgi:predicted  nucleic acid-binding Zn-ribbon protein